MSKDSAFILFLFLQLAVFCRCSIDYRAESDGYGAEFPMTDSTGAAIDSCMGYMESNPAKAHYILDSICNAKLISPQRCDYYHALILFGGEHKGDSALMICNSLLDEGKFGEDIYIEEEICVLASNITSVKRRHFETLKYALRGIEICHGNEQMRSDEASLLARVGVAAQMLGQTERAKETYAKAYELLKEDKTFGGFIGIISLIKKQAALAYDAKDYNQVIVFSHQVLNLVNRFDLDPSFIEERPETMRESSSATRNFAGFYECQMYGNIAHAYRKKIEQGHSTDIKSDTDSLNYYIDLWSQTGGSQTPENLALVLGDLYFAGRKAAFLEAKDLVGEFYQSDSLATEYIDYLSLMAQDASSRHDYAQGFSFLQRALVVSDSLRQRELLSSLTEQMSVNMVQEERLSRQDAEYQVSRQRLIILLLSIILIILVGAGLVIVLLMQRNRKKQQIIEMTQQDLTETKEEIRELSQQLEETKVEKSANNTKALFERIEAVMIEKQLYLNPELDIKMLSEELCSSRTLISVCVNSITGKTFRQWLSEYRLSLFVEMLKEHSEESIEELMLRCGYKDQSTFRRQFKSAYGITAGEYRKRLLESMHS